MRTFQVPVLTPTPSQACPSRMCDSGCWMETVGPAAPQASSWSPASGRASFPRGPHSVLAPQSPGVQSWLGEEVVTPQLEKQHPQMNPEPHLSMSLFPSEQTSGVPGKGVGGPAQMRPVVTGSPASSEQRAPPLTYSPLPRCLGS